MMKSIATSKGMKFIDNSLQTQRDLELIGKTVPHVKPMGKVINIGIKSEDGAWATAGNTGMPKNQVAVGFSNGTQPSNAQAFADMLIHKIEERWHIETVPPNEGARGMKNCEDSLDTNHGS